MNEETINYENKTLDPSKDVAVSMSRYIPLTNVVREAQKRGTKVYREVVFSWYEKNTHAKLSKKNESKLSQEDLQARYYNTIDIDATDKNIRYFLDDIAFAGVKLDGEFRGIFKDNVDNGNFLEKPEPQGQVLPETPPVNED